MVQTSTGLRRIDSLKVDDLVLSKDTKTGTESFKKILTVYKNSKDLIDGTPLTGKQILEIPSSNENFNEIDEYVKLARDKYGIEIRFREE